MYRLTPRGRRALGEKAKAWRSFAQGVTGALEGATSGPQTINKYLAAFNEELEVGLRSRRRIFYEVTEHLRQAAEEQVRGGASPREAERRATAAFGAPEEVAARFETGLTGRLDRRLALGIRWLHRFATERPMGPALAMMALGMFLAVAVAVVAASFGRNVVAAAGFVPMATVVALMYVWPSRRRELGEMLSRSASPLLAGHLAYPAVTSCVVLLGGAGAVTSWQGHLAALLTYTCWFVIQWATAGVIDRAARRSSGATEAERRLDWRAEHSWRAALAAVAPLPLALLALIVATRMTTAPSTQHRRIGARPHRPRRAPAVQRAGDGRRI